MHDDCMIMDPPWEHAVERFCRQYLQLEPQPDFPQGSYLRLPEVQDAIHTRLFQIGSLQHEPPMRYKVKTLKDLVSTIESSIDDWEEHEVSENLMTALSALLATPIPPEASSVQQKSYVTYHNPSLRPANDLGGALPVSGHGQQITLLENRSLIAAAGTTGLRTWDAALHLGRFLSFNQGIVQGKHILELGAGTGYLSILCAKLGAAHVIASDGSDDVINNLPDNFFLNDLPNWTHGVQAQEPSLQGHDEQPGPRSVGTVTLMDVKWGHALMGTEEQDWNGGRPVDVVIGADVTYDRSANPALVGTILELFTLYPRVDVYISAMQRNHETFQVFLDKCQLHGLRVDNLDYPVPTRGEQEGPFYSDWVEIRICRVSQMQK